MNQTMSKIAVAVTQAIVTRHTGQPFRKVIPSHDYVVERDVPASGYHSPGEGGTVLVYYHGTAVARINPDGSVRLDSGRYMGPTTKNVINAALHGGRYGIEVRQVKGNWQIHDESGVARRFADGIVIRETPIGNVSVRQYEYIYPDADKRCRYDFGIIGVYHGQPRADLSGMCETCRAS